MSIRPPSDLVLDVVRNADPARAALAARALGAEAADGGFEGALAGVAAPLPPAAWHAGAPQGERPAGSLREAATRLEQVVLATFVEAMLPKATGSAFGGGTAGPVWRGMMADAIARALAKGGGIGVARLIARHEGAAASVAIPTGEGRHAG